MFAKGCSRGDAEGEGKNRGDSQNGWKKRDEFKEAPSFTVLWRGGSLRKRRREIGREGRGRLRQRCWHKGSRGEGRKGERGLFGVRAGGDALAGGEERASSKRGGAKRSNDFSEFAPMLIVRMIHEFRRRTQKKCRGES